MKKLFNLTKVALGIATLTAVVLTSSELYVNTFAAAPGAGKEYVEAYYEPQPAASSQQGNEAPSQQGNEASSQQENKAPSQQKNEEPSSQENETSSQQKNEEPSQQENEVPSQQENVTPSQQTPKNLHLNVQPEATSTPQSKETPQATSTPQSKETPQAASTPKTSASTTINASQETVKDEVFTVEAPQRIYDVNWNISPNDWTYTTTKWSDGKATVEGHYGSDEEVQRMYELINKYRIANGKEPLTYNLKMDTCKFGANERAITSSNYWEHWSYTFSENIAYTPVFYSEYDSMDMVEKVFESWINSPGHRNNILNAGSTHHETAISVFYKKVEGGYERYWVQCFR